MYKSRTDSTVNVFLGSVVLSVKIFCLTYNLPKLPSFIAFIIFCLFSGESQTHIGVNAEENRAAINRPSANQDNSQLLSCCKFVTTPPSKFKIPL